MFCRWFHLDDGGCDEPSVNSHSHSDVDVLVVFNAPFYVRGVHDGVLRWIDRVGKKGMLIK